MVKKTLPKNRKTTDVDSIIDFRLGSLPHRAREYARKHALKIAERVYGDLFYSIAVGQQLSERYANSLEIKLATTFAEIDVLGTTFLSCLA